MKKDKVLRDHSNDDRATDMLMSGDDTWHSCIQLLHCIGDMVKIHVHEIASCYMQGYFIPLWCSKTSELGKPSKRLVDSFVDKENGMEVPCKLLISHIACELLTWLSPCCRSLHAIIPSFPARFQSVPRNLCYSSSKGIQKHHRFCTRIAFYKSFLQLAFWQAIT